jgi:hypothetical protein
MAKKVVGIFLLVGLQGRDTTRPGAGLRVFMRLRLDAKMWCASWGARYSHGENSAARYLGEGGIGARCLSQRTHQLQCLWLILLIVGAACMHSRLVLDVTSPIGLWFMLRPLAAGTWGWWDDWT